MTYNVPSSYYGIPPKDIRIIGTMSWFSRATVLENVAKDVANYFAQLQLEAWYGPFYWGVDIVVLESMVLQRFIAMDYLDLLFHVSADAKRTHHVS